MNVETIERAWLRKYIRLAEDRISECLDSLVRSPGDGWAVAEVPLPGLVTDEFPDCPVDLALHAGHAEDGGGYHFAIWHGNGERRAVDGDVEEMRHVIRALPAMFARLERLLNPDRKEYLQ